MKDNQEGGVPRHSSRSRSLALQRTLRRQQIEGKIDRYIQKELKEINEQLSKINSTKISSLPIIFGKRTDGKPKPSYSLSGIKKASRSKKDVVMMDPDEVERKKKFLEEKRKIVSELARQRRLEKKAKEEERKARAQQAVELKKAMKLLESFGVEEKEASSRRRKKTAEVDPALILQDDQMSDSSRGRSARASTRAQTEMKDAIHEIKQIEKKRKVEFEKQFKQDMDELSGLLQGFSVSNSMQGLSHLFGNTRLSPIKE